MKYFPKGSDFKFVLWCVTTWFPIYTNKTKFFTGLSIIHVSFGFNQINDCWTFWSISAM